MLKNENIICISSIDWDFIWQGHQEIMSTFAKNGNRVLFIENTGVRTPTLKDIHRLKKRIVSWFKSTKGFKEEMDNLYVYSPIFIPLPFSKVARQINKWMVLMSIKRWMKVMKFYNPIIWTYLPTGLVLDILHGIDNKIVIYYCVANFYELAGNRKIMKQTENELLKSCDLVFAQGKSLENKCKKLNGNVTVFPGGVNIDQFKKFVKSKDGIPSDIKDIKIPIIGYIGGIHRHIDFSLIKYIAKKHPEWSIVFVGPVQTDVSEISELPNIHFLGKKDFSILPHYINKFNACIIPYQITEYTKTVYPTKMNEYHAMGKPVVSSQLPEIKYFNEKNDNLIYISGTKEEFIVNLKLAIGNTQEKEKRIKTAENNTWSSKIERMSVIINESIKEKAEKTKTASWEIKLIKTYLNNRRKFVKWILAPLLLYFIIFYSPLVRTLANPLIISQLPEKANVIVVIGGGAGESGIPGQGYEERVMHAVDLYKKDYANKIIYSSGYTYLIKEPDVMKALSLSLDVRKTDIILDTASGSTYQSIMAVREILKKNGWNKILLVSSPYHMLRASLVLKENIPDIKVIYTPIPISQFYSYHSSTKIQWIKKLTWNQMRGFLHEYLGIIYYWWKGYI